MDKLTFIKHVRNPLSKTFFKDGKVSSYPGAKLLNSVEKEVPFTKEGLQEKHKLMRLFAKQGFAAMKGPLTKILDRESRAGKSDRNARTRTVVLDFDDLRIPGYQVPEELDQEQLKRVSEEVVARLPHAFQSTSYIATASSSMGLKRERIGLHLEFWLADEIAPAILKDYLEHLNFAHPYFEEQLRLTDSGLALSYRVDKTVADNSHIIYIAPPVFEDKKQNPFKKDEDRIILVEKQENTVNLTLELLQIKPERIKSQHKDRYERLYEAKYGIKPKKAKNKRLQLASGVTSVRINPTVVRMTMVADYGDYCTFNVDSGDSAGYFVRKAEPDIVRNYKAEDNFLFSEADQDTYQWFTSEYLPANSEGGDEKKSIGDTGPQRKVPYAFISREEDVIKYGYHNPETNELTDIYPTRLKSELESWFTQHGRLPPEQLPYHSERFDPRDERTVDLPNNFINTFRPNPILWSEKKIPEEAQGATIETVKNMQLVAPTVYDLLHHVTSGGEEFPLFVNWLAAVFQKRDKIRTAWVLHGVQGTGKGSLMDGVLKPIFASAAKAMNVTALDEKYNVWLSQSVLVMVDEFKNADASNGGKMNNRLKEYITEANVPIRKMNRDYSDWRNFANFIFFSNQYDAVYIEDSDRRYNVCPRQELSITKRFPDWKKRIEKDAPKELEGFVRFMMTFQVDWDKATTALDNQAKSDMREMSRLSQESFANALKTGNLEYFAEILNFPHMPGDPNGGARNNVTVWLRDYKEGAEVKVNNGEMRGLYKAMMGKDSGPEQFSKMMKRLGIITEGFSREGKKMRGIRVVWKISEKDRQGYMAAGVIDAHVREMGEVPATLFEPQQTVN